MFIRKIMRLFNREKEYHNAWNGIIPVDDHARVISSFIRKFCVYDGNELYYRGFVIDMNVIAEFRCSVKIGEEEIAVTYPLNEYKEVYEVRKMLDQKIFDMLMRNFNIYRVLAIDCGVSPLDISSRHDNRTMVVKCRNGKDITFDVSNVGEAALCIFRQQLKIVY